ncbi:DUF4352 domain-containing protein [Bacillus sp. ISL-55]|uniref:DUF4352 domain-containing protein n=1 Tax=Bacillus sp. ISL-55 TaxID=2819134 RepID=UPI001BE72890|nr:DUF4352 domain-containing protein [Bacillus sp. ISL-55]MBT2694786.1 DUF4352 domain-containing protein [Bacillus sp. ISL-55]
MKKFFLILISSIIITTGCSSVNEEVKPEKTKTVEALAEGAEKPQKESKKVKLNKSFKAKTSINPEHSTEVKIMVSDYQIVENKSSDADLNSKYDYVQLDVSYENTGDKETSPNLVTLYSFKFFDDNGVEIEVNTFIKQTLMDVTLKEAAVRPGGKNSGRLYFPIPKGSKPKEMVYQTNWVSIVGSNEYLFTLK